MTYSRKLVIYHLLGCFRISFDCPKKQLSPPLTQPAGSSSSGAHIACLAGHSTHSVLWCSVLWQCCSVSVFGGLVFWCSAVYRRSYPADVHKHDSLSNFHQSLFWLLLFCGLCFCDGLAGISWLWGHERKPSRWISACKIALLKYFHFITYSQAFFFLNFFFHFLCGMWLREGVPGAGQRAEIKQQSGSAC